MATKINWESQHAPLYKRKTSMLYDHNESNKKIHFQI